MIEGKDSVRDLYIRPRPVTSHSRFKSGKWKEIEARFVAAGKNVGHAGARDFEQVCELGLAEVFRLDELL